MDFSNFFSGLFINFNASSSHTGSGVVTLCNVGNCGIAASVSSEIRSNISNILKSNNNGTYTRDTVDFTYFDSVGIPFTYLETEYYDNKTAMDK